MTVAVFLPVAELDFINLDDGPYVFENEVVKEGLSSKGLVWAFTNFHSFNWHPLTWISHMVDAEIFGLSPGLHHLSSLAYHLIAVLLVYWVWRSMTGKIWQSAAVAALFAVHPTQVESVAWVAERKNLLSAIFMLLAIRCYHEYTRRIRPLTYAGAVLFFVFGLLSKQSIVSFPLILFLLDYWPLGRVRVARNALSSKGVGESRYGLRTALVLEKAPFFILSVCSGLVAYLAQVRGGSMTSLSLLPLSVRIANSTDALVQYILRIMWPHGLAVLYPYNPGSLTAARIWGSVVLLGGLSALVMRYRERYPGVLVGWCWYVVLLLPVIGLIQVGVQASADRYMYLPCIGLFVACLSVRPEFSRWSHRGKYSTAIATCLLILLLGIVSRKQLSYWRNSVSLFEHALDVTSGNWLIEYNLGIVLDRQGKYNEAISHYKRAVATNPDYFDAALRLGNLLLRRERFEEAVEYLEGAVKIKPDDARAYFGLGTAHFRMGRPRLAEKFYRDTLQLNPDITESYNNLGSVLIVLGRYDEAMVSLSEAVRRMPESELAHANIAGVLLRSGDVHKARRHYEMALKIRPGYGIAVEGLNQAIRMSSESGRK